MGMRRAMEEEVNWLLDCAEERGACLATTNARPRKALEARVRGGALVSPMPKLFARSETWEALNPAEQHLHKMRGINELHPCWMFCGVSAAVAYGLSVSYGLIGDVEVASDQSRASVQGGGLRWRYVQGELPGKALWLPVTVLFRTMFDCARRMSFRDGLAVVDSGLRRAHATRDDFVAYVEGMSGGFEGLGQAKMTAAHASPLAESGGESIARAVMYELGFAEPELQAEVADPLGSGRAFRVDFTWTLADGTVILGELDGGEKYLDAAMNGGSPVTAMRRERLRESRLTASGARIVRFSMEDVRDPARFSALLEAFGVPRDHEPLVEVADSPAAELVPVEAYGV